MSIYVLQTKAFRESFSPTSNTVLFITQYMTVMTNVYVLQKKKKCEERTNKREKKKEEEKEKQNKIIRSNKREHRIFPCLICRMPPTQQREAYTDRHTQFNRLQANQIMRNFL